MGPNKINSFHSSEPINHEEVQISHENEGLVQKSNNLIYEMLKGDFTDPEVMKSFANAAASETGIFFMNACYQSPDIIKALHNPIFQDAIISAMLEKQKSDQPYHGKATPSFLLMLVGDRNIIKDMQNRGAFNHFPEINPYVNYTISRIKQNKTTDRDIVLLFDEYTAMDDLLFNFNNSLTPFGIKQAISAFIPITALDVKEDFWQYCLDERDFRLITDQDSAVKAKMNIEKPLMNFVEGVEGHVFKEDKTVTEDNIIAALGRFITEESEDWDYSLGDDFRIKEAFQHNKTKNLALTKLRQIYLNYLKKGDFSSFPRSLQIMSDYTKERGGAGPLTQIESFLSYTGELSRADPKCRKFSKSFENKMTEAHWSNQEKTNFYNISAEILHANPEIYKSFANVLLNIQDKNDFETFTQEIFPLFRAKLAILAKYEEKESKDGKKYIATNYDAGDIISLTEQLHNALVPFNLKELTPDATKEALDHVRDKLFSEVSGLFVNKFGLLPNAVPRSFSEMDARVIKDLMLYLGNIISPSEEQNDYIGYFLALLLNDGKGWHDLRCGRNVSPSKVLNIVSAYNASQALIKSRYNNPINEQNTGIDNPDRLLAFRSALQDESISIRIGSIETSDVKLKKTMRLFERLADPSYYQNGLDRDRIVLLGQHNIKDLNRVIADVHQRLSGRTIPYRDGDQEIESSIIKILTENNISITPDSIKSFFQDDLKVLGMPFTVNNTIKSNKVAERITDLEELLTPPEHIIGIFEKVGEDFATNSDIMPVGADLDYLESILIEHRESISEEEARTVKDYIEQIRTRKANIDQIYESVARYFKKNHRPVSDDPAGHLIEHIDHIISNGDESNVIISTLSSNFLDVIENIRACLSCKTKARNNDTNLTFIEGYKFFLYSNSVVDQEESSTDEIVYFLPSESDGDRKMSFVMDKLYGIKNTDVLLAHVEAVIKKTRALEQNFSEVPISIILPASTYSSCGVYYDEIKNNLEELSDIEVSDPKNICVSISPFGFGDHYVEFSDLEDVRPRGPVITYGIEITVNPTTKL